MIATVPSTFQREQFILHVVRLVCAIFDRKTPVCLFESVPKMGVPQDVLIAAPSLSKSENQKQEESSSIITNGPGCIQQNGSSKKTGKSTNGLNHQASVFYFNINKSSIVSPDKEIEMKRLDHCNTFTIRGVDDSYHVVEMDHRNIKSEYNSFHNGSIRVMQSDSSEESGDSLEEAFGDLNLQRSQRLTGYGAAPKRVPRWKLRASPTFSLGDYMTPSVSPKKEVEKTDYSFPRLRRELYVKENAPPSALTNLLKKSHDEKENTSPNVSNPNGHGLDINLNEVMKSDEVNQELKNHAPNMPGPLQESNFQVADQPSAQIENCEHSFLLSAKLCGRLIGKKGSHVKQIMEMTGVSVEVRQAIPTPDDELHFVVLSGPKNTMMKARQMIRNRFPLDKFPDVNLDVARVPVFSQEIGLPETRFLLRVSYITGSATVYVQQPEHHAFFQHAYFQQNMTNYYRNNSSPPVLNPLPGDIYVYECESLHYPTHGSACNPIREIACHRVEVVELAEDDCIVVKNVDYGGLWTVPVESLRQMLPEFFKLPFLATECALWNIQPNGPGWSQAAFDHLVSCSKGFMLGQVYQVDSINYICLYRILPNNVVVCINDEMVMMDMAANAAMVPQGVDGAIIASQGMNGFTVQPEAAAAAMAHQGMNNGLMDPQVAASMAPQGAEPEMIHQQMAAFMAPQESDTAYPEMASSVAPLEEKAELAPPAGEGAELAQK